MVYPLDIPQCNPVNYIKVRCKGVYISQTIFPDEVVELRFEMNHAENVLGYRGRHNRFKMYGLVSLCSDALK